MVTVATLPVAQSTSAPFGPSQTKVVATMPASTAWSTTLASSTCLTGSLNDTAVAPATPVGGVNVAVGATRSDPATRTGSKASPLYQSLSTHPVIPGTLPQSPYCQKVQPLPCQSFAGSVGDATFQCAIHNTVKPASAMVVVSPVRSLQPIGLVYTIGLTPVRVTTSPNHARIQFVSSVDERPPVRSTSSTGRRSPGAGCATSTK